jgi:TPR repeat protein
MYAMGEGVEKNAVQAVHWWQKAAEQGQAEAQEHLGRMYASGKGVEKNAVQAVCWWQKAAVQGITSAQASLGTMYSRGEGVQLDLREAARWCGEWRQIREMLLRTTALVD